MGLNSPKQEAADRLPSVFRVNSLVLNFEGVNIFFILQVGTYDRPNMWS